MREISKHNATKEEIINTCEETFGKECYDEEFWEDYTQNTAEKKNNSEETGSNN